MMMIMVFSKLNLTRLVCLCGWRPQNRDENGRKEGEREVEGGVRKPNADDCYYFSLCLWISSCCRVLFCGAAIDRVQLANSAPAGVRGSSVEGESADGQH